MLENPSVNMTTLHHKDLVNIIYDSKARYNSIISTNNPDLSGFKQASSKMITWHRLADKLIFPKGTEQYSNRIEAKDSDVQDYYQHLQAPGVHHCREGSGLIPEDPLSAVIAWVEEGMLLDTLHAVTLDGERDRDLCQYPLVSVSLLAHILSLPDVRFGSARPSPKGHCTVGYSCIRVLRYDSVS